jgi:hypothetical protein
MQTGAGGYIRATSFGGAWRVSEGWFFAEFLRLLMKYQALYVVESHPCALNQQECVRMGVPADLVRIHNYRDLIRGVARKVVAITRITGSDGPRSRGRELQLASSVSGRWTDRARARLASAGDHRDGALRFE